MFSSQISSKGNRPHTNLRSHRICTFSDSQIRKKIILAAYVMKMCSWNIVTIIIFFFLLSCCSAFQLTGWVYKLCAFYSENSSGVGKPVGNPSEIRLNDVTFDL